MVSVAHLIDDATDIFEEIQRREDAAEDARLHEYLAARRIQAAWRGHIERKHLARINRAAVVIQTAWRGYWARVLYLRMLAEALAEMERLFYHRAATRIQAWWRGTWVRMRVCSVGERRRWCASVLEANEKLLQRIKEQLERGQREAALNLEADAKQWVLFVLFKLHHLTRTRRIPGVFSLHNCVELSAIEEQLKAVGFMDYHVTQCSEGKPDPDPIFPRPLRRCEAFWNMRDVSETWAELDRRAEIEAHKIRCINPPMRFPRFTIRAPSPPLNEPPPPRRDKAAVRRSPKPPLPPPPPAEPNPPPPADTAGKAIGRRGGFVSVTPSGKLREKVLFTPRRRAQFDAWLA